MKNEGLKNGETKGEEFMAQPGSKTFLLQERDEVRLANEEAAKLRRDWEIYQDGMQWVGIINGVLIILTALIVGGLTAVLIAWLRS